jgi:hypothetical protein
MLWDINNHLKDDVSSDIILEHFMDVKAGIFIAASRVPTSSETACVLKHVRRLVTISGVVLIQAVPVTSTSFLKVIDVPHIPAEPKVWQTTQRAAFQAALRSSPVGASLDKFIKHAPRFMRTSPHADTCVAWINISDSVSGSNARNFIGKQVVIGGRNCQIRGAAPRPRSAQCTRCMRWGHHATVCRSKGIRCPLFFFFFFFFNFNGIYFKIDLKGGLNRSLDFTSPVYRCSNYSTRTSHKLYTGASRQTERERMKKLRESAYKQRHGETIFMLFVDFVTL